jgi:hypothetical protein
VQRAHRAPNGDIRAVKIAIAVKVGSRALRADAMEAVTCGWLSWVVVISLAAQRMTGARWIDNVGSLAIAWFLIKDGARSMGARRVLLLSSAVLLIFTASAQAQEREPSAIIEIGGNAEWGLSGASSVGPSAAVEFTPIKDWLEIEAGVAPMFSRGLAEWDTDLIFKKPFTLSDTLEFMFDVGPQWTFSRAGTRVGSELAADFMFWPTPDRKYGWFLEPTYSYSFSGGREQSVAVSAGLLISIP